MSLKATVLVILILTSTAARSQSRTVAREKPDFVAIELQDIITESAKLDNSLARVHVRGRAAALMSYYDAVRSETMFRALWLFCNQRLERDSEKEQAKLVVLKYLFSRNPKLAREFLAEQSKSTNSSKTAAADPGNSRLSTKLAANLIDTDPSMAAALLERSLMNNTSPAGIGALVHLREKDSFLSDYIAAKIIEGLLSKPTLVSLATLQLFAAYTFPGPDAPIISVEAQSSLESLQFRYFFTGYEVLRTSLAEADEPLRLQQHYTQRDLEFRAANQAQIAAILAALAPRLQPSLATELNAIAGRLSSQVPPNIAQMTKLALARLRGDQFKSDDPEESFVFALTNGDFEEARRALERITDETKSKTYAQLLIKSEARALLAHSELMPALIKIRNLEDQTTRLVMYLDAVRAAKRKREPEMTRLIIDEARLLIPQTDRNGLHIRALFSFAAQLDAETDAVDFLDSAVTSVNKLQKGSANENEAQTLSEAAMAELNDPISLLDAPEMEQSFTSFGLHDPDKGLAEAKRIEDRSVQLVARLEVLQGFTKGNSRGSKARSESPKISSSPK